MDPEFDELKREFLADAASKLDEIEEQLRGDGAEGDASRERAFYLAHQLKGAGGSYGFATISTEAAALEKDLEASPVEVARVTERIAQLRSVIEERKRELGA